MIDMLKSRKDTPAVLTVLVVDDEAPVRVVQRRILEEDGYQVLEAADGAQGVALLAGDVHLDLLIADLDMPVLSGDEMVRCVRLARPDLRVLYVTGHIDRLMDARPLWEGEAFLEKPFSGAGLREAVSLLVRGTIGRRDVGKN
jgi:two-component system cell cycle sensor histidine kinase/response regulator CckA